MTWLTVVVPVYNQAAYLGACLNSLAEQTCAEWECIVVDDGSTDASGEVAARLAARDPRIRYHRQPNSGVAAARNRGLELARGDWIAFLDADDLYFPEAVAAFRDARDALARHDCPAGILAGRLITSFQEPPPPVSAPVLEVRDLFFRTMHFETRGRSPLLQNTVFHRPLLQIIGGFWPALRTAEDRDLLIRAAAVSEVAQLPALVAYYRTDHGAGKSDRCLAEGLKASAHRQIFEALPASRALALRAARRGRDEGLERLRTAYFLMLEAVEAVRAGELTGAAASLERMADQLAGEEEERAFIGRFGFFFRYPSARPRAAIGRCRQALQRVSACVAAGTPLREALERQIRREAGRLIASPTRQTVHIVPSGLHDRTRSEPAAVLPLGFVDAPRFALGPLLREPVGGGRVLLCAPGGSPLVVDADIAEALRSCTRFRSAEQHVQLAVTRGGLSNDRRPALRSALAALATSGAVHLVGDLLRRPFHPPRSGPPLLSTIVVLAHDGTRRAVRNLRSYLTNARDHGRRPAVLVMGGGSDDERGEGQLARLAREMGVAIRHSTRRDRRRFARLLARVTGMPSDLADVALGAPGVAALMNAALLEAGGQCLLVTDGRSRCAPAQPHAGDEVLCLTSDGAAIATELFPTTAALAAERRPVEVDFLGQHERYLGKPCRALLGMFAQVDLDGDYASYLSPPPDREPYLVATVSSRYGSLAAGRPGVAWEGVPDTMISRGPSLPLTATALWNRTDSLAPFLPAGRSSPALFAWMLGAVDERVRMAFLPLGVEVGVRAARNEARNPFDIGALVEAALASYHPPFCGQGAQSLAAIGDHLGEVASLPAREFVSLLRPPMAAWVSRALAGDFTEEVRRAQEERLLAALTRDLPEAQLAAARQRFRLCRDLLAAWPQVVATVARLGEEGVAPSRAVGSALAARPVAPGVPA
jgi:GT2 family glycosyltransferase